MLDRWDFVFLLAHVDVAQDQAGGHLEGAHQVGGGAVGEVIEAPAQRLAIESHDPHAVAADLIGQHGGVEAERAFQFGRIKVLQHEPDRRIGRGTPPAQTEGCLQTAEMDVDEGMDAAVGVGSRDHGQDGEQQQMRQWVQPALGAARVRDGPEQIEQMGESSHGNPDWLGRRRKNHAKVPLRIQKMRPLATAPSAVANPTHPLTRSAEQP